MITKKTLFINKKFSKFHDKNMLEKIKKKLPLLPSSPYSKLIIYKYKNYILEAPIDVSKKAFTFLFGYDKDSNFLKNFEIIEYEDDQNFENIKNTDTDIYINKRQISFFKFVIDGFEVLFYLQSDFIEKTKNAILEKITKKLSKQSVIY